MPTDLPGSVLFVITRGDSIGGGQIHVRDLARRLQERGVRVAVATGSVGPLQSELDHTGIRHFLIPGLVRSINPLDDFVAIQALRRRMRQFRPDLVSCHTAKAGLVGRLAAWLERVPFVFTAHGWQFAEGIPFWQKTVVLAVETLMSRFTPRIITVSGYDRELALQYRLGSPAKIVLVHNGMPWLDRPERRATVPPVRLIMVARFQAQKDHATLFEALARVEHLPWQIELVGDGPELARWTSWVADRGWSDRVSFAGQVMDVPRRMASADVFLLISLWEGFPRSILEAMRACLPVVATRVGGVDEAVVEGGTGYLVPPRDVESLAERLRTLISSSETRLRLGEAGRDRYEAEFTFDAMLENTLRVWRRVRG